MTSDLSPDIEQIVQSVFAIMLNLDVARDDAPYEEHDCLLTSVQIAGEWMGCVVLELSPAAARAAASAMLQLPDESLTAADCEETAAELANVIGGNVKCLLPGPSLLSMPTVLNGNENGLRVHRAELIDELCFTSEAGRLRVRLFERPDESDSPSARFGRAVAMLPVSCALPVASTFTLTNEV